MTWPDHETIIAILAIFGIGGGVGVAKKFDKLPSFGNKSNGGDRAMKDHVKTVHAPIDAALSKYALEFIDMGKLQVEQNLLIKSNTERLNSGNERFLKVEAAMHNIDKSLAVLADRSKGKRSSDK